MKVRTWWLEAGLVWLVLCFVTELSGNFGDWRAWVCTVAVMLSFLHAQVSERLATAEGRRRVVLVPCYRWAVRYYVGKELAWALWFVATGAWPALAGCVVFMVYPFWRGWWTARLKPTASAWTQPAGSYSCVMCGTIMGPDDKGLAHTPCMPRCFQCDLRLRMEPNGYVLVSHATDCPGNPSFEHPAPYPDPFRTGAEWVHPR